MTTATQGVEDAIENWWHMELLLDDARNEIQTAHFQINNWEREYTRLQKQARRGIVGFTIGGVTFGVGVPLLIEGIRSDNQTMLWTGAGTLIIGSAIWAAGHFIFNWF